MDLWMLTRFDTGLSIVDFEDKNESAQFQIRKIDPVRQTVESSTKALTAGLHRRLVWSNFSELTSSSVTIVNDYKKGLIGELVTDSTDYSVLMLGDGSVHGPFTMATKIPKVVPMVYHGEQGTFSLMYNLRDSLCEKPSEEKIRYVEGGLLTNGTWSEYQFELERRLDKKNFRSNLVATTSNKQPVIWSIDICDSGIVGVSRFDRSGSSFVRGWKYEMRESETSVREGLDWAVIEPANVRVYDDGILIVLESRTRTFASPSMNYMPMPIYYQPGMNAGYRFSDSRIQSTSLDSWTYRINSRGFVFVFVEFSGKVRWKTVIDRNGTSELEWQSGGGHDSDGMLSIGPTIGTQLPMAWRDVDNKRIVTAFIDLASGDISDHKGVVSIDDMASWYARKWTPDGKLRCLTSIKGREIVPLIIDATK
ncbi:MAG: hypothetical protein IPP80_02200 [Ignavibacteria bacterium]|nr:hypothetical protein [Ignavibacteria bacterium]MBK6419572.1 hypothetical protein [Ignavibacteria bacterium]MBL0321189.1 hypothetical protein [Ignavibacteria bacterium]MBP7093566.1 hypothetical protein [Candidatus Kapabacteria bacterium]